MITFVFDKRNIVLTGYSVSCKMSFKFVYLYRTVWNKHSMSEVIKLDPVSVLVAKRRKIKNENVSVQ